MQFAIQYSLLLWGLFCDIRSASITHPQDGLWPAIGLFPTAITNPLKKKTVKRLCVCVCRIFFPLVTYPLFIDFGVLHKREAALNCAGHCNIMVVVHFFKIFYKTISLLSLLTS